MQDDRAQLGNNYTMPGRSSFKLHGFGRYLVVMLLLKFLLSVVPSKFLQLKNFFLSFRY